MSFASSDATVPPRITAKPTCECRKASNDEASKCVEGELRLFPKTNMDTTITANITQNDIDEGEEQNCSQCPTALAIRRATGAKRIVVGRTHIYVDDLAYATPDEANVFIARFDHGRSVKPYKLVLTNPKKRTKVV